MREIMLRVTPQQEKWLKHFAKYQSEGSPDNKGTYKPIHLVQTRNESLVFDGGECGTDTAYWDSDLCGSFGTPESILEAHGIDNYVAYEEALENGIGDAVIMSDTEYFAYYGIRYIQTVSICYEWETKSYHFTLQSARDYIKYQGHNLRCPRTHTAGPGYSNKGDYELFFDFLMAAGTSLLEQDNVINAKAPGSENSPESESEQGGYFPDVDYVDTEWGIGKQQGGVKK